MKNGDAFNGQRQTGAVMVATLIILLVITIISVSMFRDIGLQETMSGNYRSKNRTMHVANSALREQWVNLLNLLPGEDATDARARSYPTIYDQDLDGDPLTVEVDMNVDVAICFDGNAVAPGTDTEFEAYKFQISSTAADNSNATSQVAQGGYIVAPRSAVPLLNTCP